jgi:hypothetical protein
MRNKYGIPTTYNGHRFRSRLEARWAAFFDLLGWRWEYEPRDFDGWIPDFVIYGKAPVYVEIKPVVEFPEEVAAKIKRSGCCHEVLICGETFPLPSEGYDGCNPVIGWLGEVGPSGELAWGEAVLGKWKAGGGEIGVCHAEMAFSDRITGTYDGGTFGGIIDEGLEGKTTELWREACEKVQWIAKGDSVRGREMERHDV